MRKRNLLVTTLLIFFMGLFLVSCGKVKYKLEFIVDDSVYATINTNGEESLTMPESPTKDNYRFDGWFWDNNEWKRPFTANSLLNEPLSSNMKVYAKWVDEDAPIDAEVRFEGFTQVDSTTYKISISNVTEIFDFKEVVEIGGNSSWKLTTDISGNNIIVSKISALSLGDNTYYVVVTTPDEDDQTYTLKVRRRPIYLVEFNANGGSDITSQNIEEDSLASLPNEPTKTGYNFDSWDFSFESPITEPIIVNASWDAESYIITLNPDGGELTQTTITVTYDQFFVLPVPTIEEYLFDGWYDGTEKIENGIWRIASEKTLTAKWRRLITFLTTDNQITGVTEDGKTLSSIIIPEGFTSIGAKAFEDCENLTSITISSSITSIGDYAFYNCIHLTNINFNATNMNDLISSSNVFTRAGISGSGMTVNIGANVTKIPAYLFHRSTSDFSKITRVVFAENSVCNYIGERAFHYCISLKDITIPSVVTTIGSYAFSGCSSLTNITIPSGVTMIEKSVFSGCSKLTNITIPSWVTSIGSGAFSSCTNLININFNATNLSNLFGGNNTFSSAGKNSSGITVNIGANVTKIPAYLFAGDAGSGPKIISVVFAENSVCDSIGNGAFSGSASLTNITIPSSVTTIGSSAFRECSTLTNITIPSSVTTIGSSAFKECSTLTNITIPSGVTTIGNSTFRDCSELANIIIPSEVTTIEDYAFYNCTSLTNITIPSGVATIGISVFSGCTALQSITLPFVGQGTSAMDANSLFGYIFGTSSYAYATETTQYYSSTDFTKYYIPNSLKTVVITGGTINYGAFYGCLNLTSITISSGVSSIGDRAFYSCTRLTNITIQSGVIAIGNYAFYSCTGLTNITIPSSITSIGESAFRSCSISNITIPSGVTTIGNSTFRDCLKLTNITLPSEVITIESCAFYDCASLTNITIPSGVTTMGGSAFYNCTKLININFNAINMSDLTSSSHIFDNAGINGDGITLNIGANVTKIPARLFYVTEIAVKPKITSVVFAENSECTSIGNLAFYYCTGLTNITIPSGVTTIGYSVFSSCTGLTNITIPSGVTTIGNSTFSGCTSLISITLSSGVTTIESYAFNGCTSLTNITIPSGVTTIGSDVFDGCTSLTDVYYKGTADDWSKITISNNNTVLIGANRYYYIEEEADVPDGDGKYWHYVNGIPTSW